MKMMDRKIAMTDVETSGDVFGLHEILEIGLVVFDQDSFEITDTLNIKTKPLNIKNAVPAALQRNGYNEKDWVGAILLSEAMKIYGDKTKECIFCAYNATFDWGFINDAFRKVDIQNPMSTRENHSRLDLLSIAYAKGLDKSNSLSLSSACEMFGVPPEPEPHNALNGAMTAYELFKKLKNK